VFINKKKGRNKNERKRSDVGGIPSPRAADLSLHLKLA
jgi:hypothetical protein